MKNLMKAELFKLRKLIAYKVLLITYLIIEIAVQMNNISNSIVYPKYNPTYTGIKWMETQHSLTLLYSLVVFLFVAFYLKGDCVRHTFYTGLLCGKPRKSIFGAKLIAVFVGVIPLMLVSFLPGAVLWTIHAGFGMDFGAKAIFFIAKAFVVKQIFFSLLLVSNSVFFSVIAKSKIGTFGWSFGTLYVFGVLQGFIGLFITIPVFREILLFILNLFYLNFGTFLISILLKLLAAGYIFERCDLK